MNRQTLIATTLIASMTVTAIGLSEKPVIAGTISGKATFPFPPVDPDNPQLVMWNIDKENETGTIMFGDLDPEPLSDIKINDQNWELISFVVPEDEPALWEFEGNKIGDLINITIQEDGSSAGSIPITQFNNAHIPEPSSILSLLALGTLGAASTLKRKLKPSKSLEKELEKLS